MSSKSLKIIAALAIGAGLVLPLNSASAMGMRGMGGGHGFSQARGMGDMGRAGRMGHFHDFGGGGLPMAIAGAGAAISVMQMLSAAHHAEAESGGNRVDCYRFGDCHVHVVQRPGADPEVHTWPNAPKPRKHRPTGRSSGSSYDPATGVTTTSESNGNGTRTVTVTNQDGSSRQWISR